MWLKFPESLGRKCSRSSENDSEKSTNFNKLETWAFRRSNGFMKGSTATKLQTCVGESTTQRPLAC